MIISDMLFSIISNQSFLTFLMILEDYGDINLTKPKVYKLNLSCPESGLLFILEPSVMKSTVINTSKEMTAYSDFPPPDDFPNFMHQSKMYEYFQMYAENFGLLPHI